MHNLHVMVSDFVLFTIRMSQIVLLENLLKWF